VTGRYTLTEGARIDSDEIYAKSIKDFGIEQTKKYMAEFDKAAGFVAENHKRVPNRSHLTGETGLSLYPVNNHYLAYYPIADDHIVIVAVIKQVRDLPSRLNQHAERIAQQLSQAMDNIKTVHNTLPSLPAEQRGSSSKG